MAEFFTTTLGIVISLGAILTVAVTGLLYLIGVWKKGKDGEDDRLISILQETVDALEKKFDKQKSSYDEEVVSLNEKIDKLTNKVDHLEKENGTLTRVLQGRDESTQEFYKRAYAAMELNVQIHDIMTTVAKSIADTNTTMNRMVDLLSKSVDVVGQVTAGKQ